MTHHFKKDGSVAIKKGKNFAGTIPAPSKPPTINKVVVPQKIKPAIETFTVPELHPIIEGNFTTTEISRGVRFPEPDEQRLFVKLLAIGGEQAVVAQFPEQHVSMMLERGFFSPEGIIVTLKKGRPNNCHENAAKLWKLGKGALMTGYALSSDGLWRQHSWVKTTRTIIETTVPRERYYGFELTAEEAMGFYEDNLY
jgi:hypothetical protein